MTENEYFYQAFKYLEQYEEYRFTKAWGIMMIVIGASSLITGFLYQFLPIIPTGDPFAFMRTITRANAGESVVKRIMNLVMYCPIILSFFIAVYLFFTIKRTKLTDSTEIKLHKYTYFGLALFLMCLLPFLAFSLFKVYYPIFAIIGVISSFLSYFLLKRVQKSTDFRELMNLCIVLIVFTLPGIATTLIELWVNQKWFLWEIFSSFVTTPENLRIIYEISQLSYFMVFSTGCIVSGYFSIQNGFKILKDVTRTHN